MSQGLIGAASSTHDRHGDGLRTKKVVAPAGQQGTDYVWDVGAPLPVILQETTNGQTTYYVYGLDLISSIQGTTATYYLYDGLGSTTGLADDMGGLTDTYTYDAFGATRSHTGMSPQPFKFTGELEDGDVVLEPYYLRARYYEPAVGRFMTRDPLPLLQHYIYGRNSPVRYLEYSGLCSHDDDWWNVVDLVKECTDDVAAGGAEVLGDVVDCLTDVSCSQQVSRTLDRVAATLSGLSASVVNAATAAGCASTGVVGCLLAKGVAEIATAPLRIGSNFASIGSTLGGCSGRLFGEGKEGGGFTRSNITGCRASGLITVIGFIPESNIDAIAAGYQLCRSEGRCQP